jgi:broad specificity phosphatase PhoE
MARAFAEYYSSPSWRAIYTSPLQRALQTSAIVSKKHGLPVTVADGLLELDYGLWDHRLKAEITSKPEYMAWSADPRALSPPQGETASEVARRASAVIEGIRCTHSTQDVLVITHKATIRILICHYIGIDLRRFRERIANPIASLSCLRFDRGGPMLVTLANVAHLPQECQNNSDSPAEGEAT